MAIGGPPAAYYFEDRTGLVASSDFDEVYDRKFLRVSSTPQRTQNAGIMIYDMGRRSTSYADRHHFYREPAIVLDFGPNGALGAILFTQTAASVPMTQYLRKVSFFGGLARDRLASFPMLTRCYVPELCFENSRLQMERNTDGAIVWTQTTSGRCVRCHHVDFRVSAWRGLLISMPIQYSVPELRRLYCRALQPQTARPTCLRYVWKHPDCVRDLCTIVNW